MPLAVRNVAVLSIIFRSDGGRHWGWGLAMAYGRGEAGEVEGEAGECGCMTDRHADCVVIIIAHHSSRPPRKESTQLLLQKTIKL